MDQRTFLKTLVGGLLVAPLPAEAQQVGKVPGRSQDVCPQVRSFLLADPEPGPSPNFPRNVSLESPLVRLYLPRAPRWPLGGD